MGIRIALLCLAVFVAFCHSADAQLDINLVGSDGSSIDLATLLVEGGSVPDLCVGVSYSLVGAYDLTSICETPPDFTAIVNLDGNALITSEGLSGNFDQAIPPSVTAAPGSLTFSLALSGGLFINDNSVSCAEAIQAVLEADRVTVNVVECDGANTKKKLTPLAWLTEAIKKYMAAKAALLG